MRKIKDLKIKDDNEVLVLQKNRKKVRENLPKDTLDLSAGKPMVKPRKAETNDVKVEKNPEEFVFVSQKEEVEIEPSKYTELKRFVIAAFVVLFLINLFQISNKAFNIFRQVEVEAFQGYSSLVEGGKDAISSNLAGAVQDFDSAGYAFEKALDQVWFIGNNTSIVGRGNIGDSAYSLIESGRHLSSAASYFSQGASGLSDIPSQFLRYNTATDGQLKTKPKSLTEKLKVSLVMFDHALSEVEQAQQKIKGAGPMLLPSKLKGHYQDLVTQLDQLINLLHEAQNRVPAIMNILGDKYPHRYLVLLQNNTEARPTGGFIGSFLLVDVNDGYITKVEFKDVYELDGQLNEFIQAPQEIAALTDNWRMRDSNYSPDFAVSAAKAAWFLEKEGGPGVDSVIAINQSILHDLLTVTGPIEVDGLSSKLTSANYNTVITYIVESKLDGEQAPKDILNRMLPAMQDKLANPDLANNLFAALQKGIREKTILAWSNDPTVQYFYEDLGVAGKVTQIEEGEDYLSVININVGGNKSDLYMDSQITHDTVINKHGEVQNTVVYTRKHTWNPDVLLTWRNHLAPFDYGDVPDWLENILGKGTNKSMIKVYVPTGSVLTDIIGVERENLTIGLDEDINKTYFLFEMEVPAQNEQVVTIKYTLPEALYVNTADEYRLTVQKQPGSINNTRLKKRIIADPHLTNYRNYPDEITYHAGDILEYEVVLSTDQHFASLWGLQ